MSTATLIHIDINGNPVPCKATVKNCPRGENNHIRTNDPKEAQAFAEERNLAASENGMFSTLSSQKDNVGTIDDNDPIVYRVGDLSAPTEYFADLDEAITDIDAFKPEDATGRRGAVFASPDMASHSRWVQGTSYIRGKSLVSREVTVDPDKVYVYSVEAYEKASMDQTIKDMRKERFEQSAREFWDSGMTLREYRKWAHENKPERGTWEVMIPADGIIDSREIPDEEVVEKSPEDTKDEMKSALGIRDGEDYFSDDYEDEEGYDYGALN